MFEDLRFAVIEGYMLGDDSTPYSEIGTFVSSQWHVLLL